MGKGRKSACECTYDRLRARKKDKEKRERETRQEDRGDF